MGVEIFGNLRTNKTLEACLKNVRKGFAFGNTPVLAQEGTSGSYILKGPGEDAQAIAVFKPIDEEPFAPNNPRGMQAPFGTETCRPGVKSGESTIREIFAYLLDHEGFAGVPVTSFVEVTHPDLPSKPVNYTEVTSDEYRDLISGLVPLRGSNSMPKPLNQCEKAKRAKSVKMLGNLTPNSSPVSMST